tara:strand:+ start:615 stop:761 length:147 start_codon:yes stop_codon:yes gene_type:complete
VNDLRDLVINLYEMVSVLSNRVYVLEGIIKDAGVGISAPEKNELVENK